MSENREQIASLVSRHMPDHRVPGLDDLLLNALDSIKVLGLVVELQDHFGVTIDGALVNTANFQTVRTLAAMVARLQQGS